MNSSRLPGKVLLETVGKPFLELMLERIKRSKKLDEIIVATSTNPKDNKIEELCNKLKITCFRGPEKNVLKRFVLAANSVDADIIVRLNADSPTLDPVIIDHVINTFLEQINLDYVSTSFPPTRTYPDGFSVEVFYKKTLIETFSEATESFQKEHVTPFIWLQPDRYSILRLNSIRDLSNFRLNLDYVEDYKFLSKLFENFYSTNPNFSLEDMIKWFDENPKALKINDMHISKNVTFSHN